MKTARVHHAARRRGGVAAGSAGTAKADSASLFSDIRSGYLADAIPAI